MWYGPSFRFGISMAVDAVALWLTGEYGENIWSIFDFLATPGTFASNHSSVEAIYHASQVSRSL